MQRTTAVRTAGSRPPKRADEANLWHLRQCPLFQTLSAEETNSVFRSSQIVSLAPLRFVKPPPSGEPSIWIVKRGHVRLSYYDVDGRSATVVLLHPGDIFGSLTEEAEDAAFGQQAQTATAVCLCRITRGHLDRLIHRYPDLAYRFTNATIQHVQRMHMRLATYMTRSVEARLALALLELEQEFGIDSEDGGRTIDLPISHRDLAEFIGSSREMVTHVLRRFRSKSYIDSARQQICILDVEGLRGQSQS